MRTPRTSEVQLLAGEPAALSGARPRDVPGARVSPALKACPARGGGSDGESREDHAARGGPGRADGAGADAEPVLWALAARAVGEGEVLLHLRHGLQHDRD